MKRRVRDGGVWDHPALTFPSRVTAEARSQLRSRIVISTKISAISKTDNRPLGEYQAATELHIARIAKAVILASIGTKMPCRTPWSTVPTKTVSYSLRSPTITV